MSSNCHTLSSLGSIFRNSRRRTGSKLLNTSRTCSSEPVLSQPAPTLTAVCDMRQKNCRPSPAIEWDSSSGCIQTKLRVLFELQGYRTTRLSLANHMYAASRASTRGRVSGSSSANDLGIKNRNAAFPELITPGIESQMNRRLLD